MNGGRPMSDEWRAQRYEAMEAAMTDKPTDLVDKVANYLRGHLEVPDLGSPKVTDITASWGYGRHAEQIDALYAARIKELEAKPLTVVDQWEARLLEAYGEDIFPPEDATPCKDGCAAAVARAMIPGWADMLREGLSDD